MAKYAIQIVGLSVCGAGLIAALYRGNAFTACLQTLFLSYFVYRVIEIKGKAKNETKDKS